MIDKFIEEYFFLSNFYPVKIWYNQFCFPSVENAYQAQKTFDLDAQNILATMETPTEAKLYGRALELRSNWERVKVNIMRDLLCQKFYFNDELKKKLLDTGTEELIESSYWNDCFWGGNGQNILGRLLMEIREIIGTNEV